MTYLSATLRSVGLRWHLSMRRRSSVGADAAFDEAGHEATKGKSDLWEGTLGEDAARKRMSATRATAKGVDSEGRRRHSHEKASLSAGTVADDDELATDLRHNRVFDGRGYWT